MSSRDDDDDDPWLRDMVEEDLLVLFDEDEESHRRGARRLLSQVREDAELEARLIELLETAIDRGNDDTLASTLTATILGEARSTRAVGTLLRALSSDDDEMLQEAAQIALLRIGNPALTAVMERLEEDDSPVFCRAAYHLLGMAGILEDRALLESLFEHLSERLARERLRPRGESAIEDVCRTVAQLGERRLLPRLQQVLAEDFRGRHPAIQDACEQLEENVSGTPFVPTVTPWEERYAWLFVEDEVDASRRRLSRPTDAADEPGDDASADSRSRESRLLWGLNAFLGDEGDEQGLDARQFLEQPGRTEEEGEEEERVFTTEARRHGEEGEGRRGEEEEEEGTEEEDPGEGDEEG